MLFRCFLWPYKRFGIERMCWKDMIHPEGNSGECLSQEPSTKKWQELGYVPVSDIFPSRLSHLQPFTALKWHWKCIFSLTVNQWNRYTGVPRADTLALGTSSATHGHVTLSLINTYPNRSKELGECSQSQSHWMFISSCESSNLTLCDNLPDSHFVIRQNKSNLAQGGPGKHYLKKHLISQDISKTMQRYCPKFSPLSSG